MTSHLPTAESRRKIARDVVILVGTTVSVILLGGFAGLFANAYANAYVESHWVGFGMIAGFIVAILISILAAHQKTSMNIRSLNFDTSCC